MVEVQPSWLGIVRSTLMPQMEVTRLRDARRSWTGCDLGAIKAQPLGDWFDDLLVEKGPK